MALPANLSIPKARDKVIVYQPRGLHERIEQLHAHHAERCQVLLKACRDGAKSAADLITVLFGRELPDPHQTMFAMGEAIAHLNYLEHAGKLQRIEENGLTRYVS